MKDADFFMCEADAFILKNWREEKFLESVDFIKWEGATEDQK